MSRPDLARLLRERRDDIVARFVSAVQRMDLSPPGVTRSLLVDHIPKFMGEIVAELTPSGDLRLSQDAIDSSATARQHGEQRWDLGYDLQSLIREYGVLRHCIIATAKEGGLVLSMDEFDVLARCLSVGVAEAATEYVKYRDGQLNVQRANLEFLAEAGQILSSSLDYRFTLNRLTGLIVPRLADWCAVHLDGTDVDQMPLAHVDPLKVPLLRDLYRRFPLPSDSPYGHPHVTRTGAPQLLQEMGPHVIDASALDSEHLAMMRALGFRSGIVVPLTVQGHQFGALTLAYGSPSQRRYDESDLLVVGELARRAAIAIDNAGLYELSQKERLRVEAATRAKDEFVAVVSHELRTPLNAILGWLRLLRSGALPETKREHALEVIERNARAQSKLVADLLDVTRIITGKVRLDPSQLDLGHIIEMAVEGVRPAADAKGLQIEMNIERPAVMRGDGDRLQQVVWNLLSNAVKFTPKGGHVRVSLRQVDSDLELSVADDGVGIAGDFLPHVFESFRVSDAGSSRAHGGLGIGLSIAKHLVELHGGTIEALSPGTGQGAAFVVHLPIAAVISTTKGTSNVAATMPPGKEEEALASDLRGLRVLVVDDDPDARELVATVLETGGVEVATAGSAAEALAALETFMPQVVVSDIGMPGEDGYSLIRSIRSLPSKLNSLPAIALTAFARNEDRTRALLAGFNVHMAKPVEPSALVRAVAILAGSGRD
jgi:signal transduction histidine kinase/ActR/RegA family two-component response regulator